MKNVTISIDHELAAFAKKYAASHQKSLSRCIADYLKELKESEEARSSALRNYLERNSFFKSISRDWSREELYDRTILR